MHYGSCRRSKKITAGVDTKAKLALTLHEQLISFFTMRQGNTDKDFLSRFDSRSKKLEMVGGEHLFCSPKLLDKKISEATDNEVEKENERFKSTCFLLRADESRYSELLDDLKKGVYRSWDEYPKPYQELMNYLFAPPFC